MASNGHTLLDSFFEAQRFECTSKAVQVSFDDLTHVFGTQEPVREQPDERTRALLKAGWLTIEHIETALPPRQRAELVQSIQEAARAWLTHPASDDELLQQQVRWLVEKTRPHESKQQITQRVWLAAVLYNMGHRAIRFDATGQIHYAGGLTTRIGLAPDAVLDRVREAGQFTFFVSSFRQPNGTIQRGKGRQRWYVYRIVLDPVTETLYKAREKPVTEKIALIVASEQFATRPQLPRDFYGGNEFQQACIDAQDHGFTHILVLSPQHGIISLDDTVPSDQPWSTVWERHLWDWQMQVASRLSRYLLSRASVDVPPEPVVEWWPWLHPESTYELTVFGTGLPIRLLFEHLNQIGSRSPESGPNIVLTEQRSGYAIDDYDAWDNDDEALLALPDTDEAWSEEIDRLMVWASELADLVIIYVHPLAETWELAPDEVLLPTRILAEAGLDMDDFLDLLTDTTLVLEQRLPLSMILNASAIVSILLQVTHNLVHQELDGIHDILNLFPEHTLRQYVEQALQESTAEDRLCNCLTLTEQMHLLATAISPVVSEQLVVWMQTYIATRMRQRLMDAPQRE